MKYAVFAFLTSVSIFISGQANAQTTSGNPEVDLCLSEDPDLSINCLFFVKGAIQGLEMGIASVATKQGVTTEEGLVAYQGAALLACPADDVTFAQHTAVVRSYLRDHPEQWHEPLIALVLWSLIDAFPCSTN